MINIINFFNSLNYSEQIMTISILTAISCSILGSFLVLKQMSMIADAISHTAILGIVIFFFITYDLNSPLLIIGAGLMGTFTVFLIELLTNTNRMKEDSAIGIVTSLLFGIAIIVISKYAGNVHLDNDSVLMGEITFAPLNTIEILGSTLPKSVLVSSVLIIVNSAFVILLYKELKLSTFDYSFALAIGLSPTIINYIFVTLVSITSVSTFEVVGAILVISFLVGPPSTAYMLCHDLKHMILTSILISIISSIIGVKIALTLNVSISGTIACVIGVIFILILFTSPKGSIIKNIIKRLKFKYNNTHLFKD